MKSKLWMRCAWTGLLFGVVSCAPNGVTMMTGSDASVRDESVPSGDAAMLGPGSHMRSISVGGMRREYLLVVPDSYRAGQAAPLLVSLHPLGGTGPGFADGSNHLKRSAGMRGVVLAFPTGVATPGGGGSWNATYCCGAAHETDVDDVSFLRALVEEVRSVVSIDAQRIYAHGYSNGGSMSHRVAAELSTVFAAVGEFAGTIGGVDRSGIEKLPRTPEAPISVMMIHGQMDPTVPYNGGTSQDGGTLQHIGSARAIRWWAMQNGCDPTPTTMMMGGAQLEEFNNCRSGRRVRLVTLPNQDHSYPVAPGFDATDVLLEFLLTQQRTS